MFDLCLLDGLCVRLSAQAAILDAWDVENSLEAKRDSPLARELMDRRRHCRRLRADTIPITRSREHTKETIRGKPGLAASKNFVNLAFHT